LIQIDRPGYGASDALSADESPSVERFADDIAEYLRSINNEASSLSDLNFGPASAIGWSFGGYVAAALAARHPDLVDRLVIVATARPRRLQSGERFSIIAELRKHGVERGFEGLRASLKDDGAPSLLQLGIDDADPALATLGVRGQLDRSLEAGWTQDAAGVAFDRLAVRDHDWLAVADHVDVSTLLVYGAEDVLAEEKDARWFEHHIRDSALVTAPDAGHLVLLPEWARILDFVSERAEPTSDEA